MDNMKCCNITPINDIPLSFGNGLAGFVLKGSTMSTSGPLSVGNGLAGFVLKWSTMSTTGLGLVMGTGTCLTSFVNSGRKPPEKNIYGLQ